MRLDIYLVKNGVFPSRELAKFNITKGHVVVNGKVATKPSQLITESDSVELTNQPPLPYVSKGGLKLEKAIREFDINCQNVWALDVGASTGGFTDCLLQHGASGVYAIDVGTNQLAPALRSNSKVVSMENINFKNISPASLNNKQFDIVVADLSFISITKVIEFFPQFMAPKGIAIVLIKPQFEVGSSQIGKGGIVKDPKAHIQAISNIAVCAQRHNLFLRNLTSSPINDPKKNIEYLALFTFETSPEPNFFDVVTEAFEHQKHAKKRAK